MPPLTINDLPPAVLARIFALAHPRRDGLSLLLTCRHWLAVVEAEGPQHLWGSVRLDSARPGVQQLLDGGAVGKRALWAGFAKRAPHFRELGLVVRWPGRSPLHSAALRASVPGLLSSVPISGGLQSLKLNVATDQRMLASTCKAVARLTSLRRLDFRADYGGYWPLDLRPLGRFSCLALLERLRFSTGRAAGGLPPDLLPALGRLTGLDIMVSAGHNDQSDGWLRLPDGVGTALRELQLAGLGIRMAAPEAEGGAGANLSGLHHLGRLGLQDVRCPETFWDALPQLPSLTALTARTTFGGSAHERLVHAVARCEHLLELDLGTKVPPPQPLPGGLRQLTRLTMVWRPGGLWRGLPHLHRLCLVTDPFANLGVAAHPFAIANAPPDLGRHYPQLEELELEGFALSDATRAAAASTQLTRLAIAVGWRSSGGWPLWPRLPRLCSLCVRCEGPSPGLLLELGRHYPQLEELELEGLTLSEATRAAGELGRLTRLVGRLRGFAGSAGQVLHPGPYLASFKELSLSGARIYGGEAPSWVLPGALTAATSLERLDLSRNPYLRLRGAEDAALLRRLPRLQRVQLLPWQRWGEEEAAALEEVRRGLLGGAGAGAGPSHAVEVVFREA